MGPKVINVYCTACKRGHFISPELVNKTEFEAKCTKCIAFTTFKTFAFIPPGYELWDHDNHQDEIDYNSGWLEDEDPVW